ncbi:uncharacterized protein LOC121969895 [Zingiber officinale]|uniref:uncharacterized protein LOC121969895 n=1 Tax=Zingiber officinale TaxID=94328 RepID=UPI001C4CD49A|nr:uncharacterized protein LOC121969895 [Zingiber officinale]XP_042376136.1 uncharacterized protein LOC121969895 [Zingiber officinale]
MRFFTFRPSLPFSQQQLFSNRPGQNLTAPPSSDPKQQPLRSTKSEQQVYSPIVDTVVCMVEDSIMLMRLRRLSIDLMGGMWMVGILWFSLQNMDQMLSVCIKEKLWKQFQRQEKG